jgi:hypothetical protein
MEKQDIKFTLDLTMEVTICVTKVVYDVLQICAAVNKETEESYLGDVVKNKLLEGDFILHTIDNDLRENARKIKEIEQNRGQRMN